MPLERPAQHKHLLEPDLGDLSAVHTSHKASQESLAVNTASLDARFLSGSLCLPRCSAPPKPLSAMATSQIGHFLSLAADLDMDQWLDVVAR